MNTEFNCQVSFIMFKCNLSIRYQFLNHALLAILIWFHLIRNQFGYDWKSNRNSDVFETRESDSSLLIWAIHPKIHSLLFLILKPTRKWLIRVACLKNSNFFFFLIIVQKCSSSISNMVSSAEHFFSSFYVDLIRCCCCCRCCCCHFLLILYTFHWHCDNKRHYSYIIRSIFYLAFVLAGIL